jgi:hypothetical protein
VILVFGNLANLGHSSMKNHLDQNPIVIFLVTFWQKITQKKLLVKTCQEFCSVRLEPIMLQSLFLSSMGKVSRTKTFPHFTEEHSCFDVKQSHVYLV